MNDAIRPLWAKTRLLLWPENLLLISVSHAQLESALKRFLLIGKRFGAVVIERDEVSLTLPEELWHADPIPGVDVSGPYRAITFDLDVDLAAHGYFSPAAQRLAEAGISIVPQCAFLKDHLLVAAADAIKAIDLLEGLVREARGECPCPSEPSNALLTPPR